VTLSDRTTRLLVTALIVGVAYYAGVWIGFATAFPGPGSARRHMFWPPNVILLVALLVTPTRWWWPCSLTAFAAHLLAHAQLGVAPTVMALPVQFSGNVVQAVLAAFTLRRLGDRPWRVDTLRSMIALIAVAAVAAPALVSALVIYVYVLAGWMSDYAAGWRVRFLANAVSTVTLAPLLLSAAGHGLRRPRAIAPRRAAELMVVFAGLLVVDALVAQSATSLAQMPLLCAPLPLLLWAAVRFGPAGLCAGLVPTVLLFVDRTVEGPSSTPVLADDTIAVVIFLVGIAVPLLLLAALVQERGDAEERIVESQRHYRMAIVAGRVSVWDWNLETGRITVDPVLKSALGYGEDEIADTIEAWTAHVLPEDVARMRAAVQAHLDGATPYCEIEHRMRHRDGSVRWFHARGAVSARREGKAVRMSGTDTDITERKRAEEALRQSSRLSRRLAGRLISAQEQERRHIARELHDGLGQRVAVLAIAISRVRRRLEQGPDLPSAALSELSGLHRQTTELAGAIRELSHGLHSAVLEHGGLVAGLQSFVDEFGRLEDMEVAFTTAGDPRAIPPDVALALYRVAQESIRNIARHSGMRRAEMILTVGSAVELQVKDEGCGFDVSRSRRGGGLGLVSIEERVRLLHGEVQVTSQPGHGTDLRVCIPLVGTAMRRDPEGTLEPPG
jgi:PAS domain S-box-containing protein